MNKQLLDELLPRIRTIAEAAGEAILQVAAEDLSVTEKCDRSPLTRADIVADGIIRTGLDKLGSQFPILSEEGDLDNLAEKDWSTYWCVDPLDGTKEFINSLSDYTVNIALVRASRPVLGVIDAPALGCAYWAARGLGAWKCRRGDQPERITPSKCKNPASAVVSRSHLDSDTEQFLEKLGVENAVPRGSSLKICAVADGSADIYPRFGPTCLWDTAAGAAIAIEAGCTVVDLSARDLQYDPRQSIKHYGFIVSPAGMALAPAREP